MLSNSVGKILRGIRILPSFSRMMSSCPAQDSAESSAAVSTGESLEELPVEKLVKQNMEPSGPDRLKSVLVETVLNLEELDVNLYRAAHMWSAFETKNLFGGQIVGQALVAAGKTTNPELRVHSLHSYFIKSGNPKKPVLYKVENLRDGKSFSCRTVQAIQDGNVILVMNASFHKQEESPFTHQYRMPHVPDPDQLLSDKDVLKDFLKIPDTPKKMRDRAERYLAKEIPFEHRRVDAMKIIQPYNLPTEPRSMQWVRALGHIGEGNFQIHCCVAAYLSDLELAMTATLPNRQHKIGFMCSLDHSMWFHAPFRSDEWMLYELESPHSGHGRGMNFGRLWRRDGTLAVSVAQECLVRSAML